MMCWCFRVYWTVFHNLFVRCLTNVYDVVQNKVLCCCFHNLQQDKIQEQHIPTSTITNIEHDYIIGHENDASYVEIEQRKIETEPYYRVIDRATAEYLLADGENGACLVRPYKHMDFSIRYIVSVFAHGEYYHLFIRRIQGMEAYSIGQLKRNERHFNSPSELIEFYTNNVLQCTNKTSSHRVILKPIKT